ncbi:isoprenylcysteine carboxylmethyltransferase family protein [Deinococcus koreensis]|uniref:Isoprenylcysteine carboxylmethyltransferase family protein n=2 Tax=Deinococcus koreensis TaxID=2054903 RepID=A0A2K3UVT6_9DEIO|nr:isoprenylcysteine carboxylmethyltransferase family protein [Deinococcus koreensis]
MARGGAFVVGQVLLLFLIGLSGARSGRRGSVLGLALMLAGGALGLRGGRNLTPLPEPLPGGHLVTGGAYSVVRHPIYAALLLAAVGWGVYRGSGVALGWTAALGVLFHFKADHEEAALLGRFPEYAAYRARVRRFIPGLY